VETTPSRALLLALVLCLAPACGDDNASTEGCADGFRLINGTCEPSTRGDRGGNGDDSGSDAGGDDSGVDGDSPDEGRDGGAANCAELSVRCSDRGIPQACFEGNWVDSEPCPPNEVCQSGRCLQAAGCEPGEVAGCASETEQRVCDDDGEVYVSRACPDGEFCFRGACGDQICEPGRTRCAEGSDLLIESCDDDGEGWTVDNECSFDDNEVCFEGDCVTGCLASIKDPTYIGCEYWSVDLPQYEDPFGDPRAIPHAVVVANTGTRTAEVTIEAMSGVPLPESLVEVPAGAVGTLHFPRLDVENTSWSNFSFRITSTEPVVAYQFNPLNDAGVASNDASLLLPVSAIGSEYYVMSWPSGVDLPGDLGPQTGWFTIVAVEEGTTSVTIEFSADVIDGPRELAGIREGDTRVFELDQGEVINFEAESRFAFLNSYIGDLTGTHITANRSIVVFGGHEEAVIGEPEDSGSYEGGDSGPCCADHLEEQLFPVNTWRSRYLAAHSPPRGDEPDYWRVIASEPGTRLTTIPAISGLDGVTLGAGDWVEVSTRESFEISATAPIQIAQYLVSQTARGVTRTQGDPAMILAVPIDQFRSDYSLLTPAGYARDFVTVLRPAGAVVRLDGTPLPNSDFTSIGSGEFEMAHVEWEAGPHRLDSDDQPFGVSMFGYDSAVSYGYPGGLDLNGRD